MILIDFFHKIGRLNDRKIALQSSGTFGRGRWTRKRIDAQIEKLALTSKALSSVIETKWVSSKKILSQSNQSNEKKEDGDNGDDQKENESKENVSSKEPNSNPKITTSEVPEDAMIDSEDDSDLELGTPPNPDTKGMNGINGIPGINGIDELKIDKNAESVQPTSTTSATTPVSPTLGRQSSLKDKWKNMDKGTMKERLSRMRSTSKVKLGMMGTKLKKMAIESSERAKTMMNDYNSKEVKYDEEGNVLDVEIFVVKPKVDHRVMTEMDERKWLETHHRVPESDLEQGLDGDHGSNIAAQMSSPHYVDLRNESFPFPNREERAMSSGDKNVKQQLKSFFVSRDNV